MDLLEALIKMRTLSENDKHGYHFERATEGYNGIVYRATDAKDLSYAVKIARQSTRQRAWREFTITKAIHNAGITNICPKPLRLYLDVEGLNADVIISEWVKGDLLVMPPEPSDKKSWLAILQTLAQAHQIKKTDISDTIPMAATPVQQANDMLSIILDRFSNLKNEKIGHLSYQQIETIVKTLQAQIPKNWETPVPLRLIHGDCHTANMIMQARQIYLVDWENAGFADPAFDISNMTTLWRFFDLPPSHHQWLVETYAKILKDSRLVERVRVYSIIQIVHWAVNYSLFIQRRTENMNDAGRHRFSLDFQLNWQMKYYQRACELLNLS